MPNLTEEGPKFDARKNGMFLGVCTETDTETDRHRDMQTQRKADTLTGRQTDRHTHLNRQ